LSFFPFSFGHCVVCPFALFHLVIVLFVLLPFFIWSLCCLSFCPFSFGHCVVCPFALFHLVIVLSVLRFADIDDPFGSNSSHVLVETEMGMLISLKLI
jgi:hypothetical protein